MLITGLNSKKYDELRQISILRIYNSPLGGQIPSNYNDFLEKSFLIIYKSSVNQILFSKKLSEWNYVKF